MKELLSSIKVLIDKIDEKCMTQTLSCYTVKEVAEILKASENSVYNMIQSGLLKAFTVGDVGSKKPSYRISADVLDTYMHQRNEVSYER